MGPKRDDVKLDAIESWMKMEKQWWTLTCLRMYLLRIVMFNSYVKRPESQRVHWFWLPKIGDSSRFPLHLIPGTQISDIKWSKEV
jgi:hypothetical protein